LQHHDAPRERQIRRVNTGGAAHGGGPWGNQGFPHVSYCSSTRLAFAMPRLTK
jgi:hypothetical protein